MYYYLFNKDMKCIAMQEQVTFDAVEEGYTVYESDSIYRRLDSVVYEDGKVKTTVPLEEFKLNRIKNHIKHARDTRELRPIVYNGHKWDVDKDSIMRIQIAINALGDNGTITWTDANNNNVENVTANDLQNILKALAERSNRMHIKYRLLREKVMSCKSHEEVASITWNTEL